VREARLLRYLGGVVRVRFNIAWPEALRNLICVDEWQVHHGRDDYAI